MSYTNRKGGNSPKPSTHYRQKNNPFLVFTDKRKKEDDVGKDKPKPTRRPDSQHGSKKPTDPFGRLTMTALEGIFNYLFDSNTNREEVKASKDQKKPEQEKQTTKTANPLEKTKDVKPNQESDTPLTTPTSFFSTLSSILSCFEQSTRKENKPKNNQNETNPNPVEEKSPSTSPRTDPTRIAQQLSSDTSRSFRC